MEFSGEYEVYLDNSATTRPFDQVIDAMSQSMRAGFYNPSALYGKAVEAEKGLKRARQAVAAALYADEKNVIFTSGGTESDNLAIYSALNGARKGSAVLYSAAEHPAVKTACVEMANLFECEAKEIPLDSRGQLDLSALEQLLNPQVRLICLMQVCNETGVIMPVRRVARMRDRLAPRALLHVDGVQGFLRVPFSMLESGAQSYAISAHKIHGPKGVGALITQDKLRIKPMLLGGGQQRNLRSGTENTPGIAGLEAAIRQYPNTAYASSQMHGLKARLLELLRQRLPELIVLGPDVEDEDAASHILAISLPPVRSETMVHALEGDHILVGTGSACSSHKGKHSAVLTAMGMTDAIMESFIRISFSPLNTYEQIDYVADRIVKNYHMLSRYVRR